MTPEHLLLYRVHCVRMQTHWGPDVDMARFAWPKTPKEWRQTEHGAPWDTNVEMARWLLKAAQKLADKDLLTL